MYLPRELISHLYTNLLRTHHRLSPPVLILAALEPDALCACRILTALLKRDYISHKIQPVSGYGDLSRAAEELIHPMKTSVGGAGGVVICLGVGGLVDLRELLGLNVASETQQQQQQEQEDGLAGIEVWVFDARRPWNLDNVFGGQPAAATAAVLAETSGNARRRLPRVDKGRLQRSFEAGGGGIIVFDDGDIEEELTAERDAYHALAEMPEVDENENFHDSDDDDDDDSEGENDEFNQKLRTNKRKSWSDNDGGENESEHENGPPRQKRRSNSGSSISSPPPPRHRSSSLSTATSSRSPSPFQATTKAPSAKKLRRRLLALRRSHESVLEGYFQLGTCYSEPISSLMYSLASDLGREDNDLLWLTIVGVSSLELSGQTSSGLSTTGPDHHKQSSFHHQSWRTTRSSRLYALLRDEVRRLNLPASRDSPASSPSDTSIRLTPDPRFVLLRHWSLYDSMLHSPYLASRLHLWNESGVKRLHKLLAKMGVSLSQCRQSYTHMDISLKKNLGENLLKYAAVYGLDDVVPTGTGGGPLDCEGWGFVRSWGWKAQLSAMDVGVIIGAILEVGHMQSAPSPDRTQGYLTQDRSAEAVNDPSMTADAPERDDRSSALLPRFFAAYDALAPSHPSKVLEAIPLAQHLLKAILRTGTSLLAKHQIRHLRAFRMGVVKEGPDLALFASSPAALAKLALWVGEAVATSRREKRDDVEGATPLVLAALDEVRGTYVVVGTGGGVGGGSSAADKERQREKAERKRDKEKKREEKRAARAAEKAARELEGGEKGEGEEDEEEEEGEEDDSSSDEDEDDVVTEAEQERRRKRGYGRNRFGIAFTEVVEETNARVKIDSFDHCVVEVKKEDLGGFLEGLSLKTVVGR